jgi:hypothetical protein
VTGTAKLAFGLGWFFVGIAAVVWTFVAYGDWLDRRPGITGYVIGPDSTAAFYAVCVDREDHQGARLVFWPQVIERMP